MKTKQVPLFERFSYGLTDMGYNLIFMFIGTYLVYFYTDIYGIPSAVVAALLFCAKILDAVIDPLVGILMDRTTSKWGKFRPYWLWFSVPFGLLCVIVFSVPAFSMVGKIIYAFITYIVINIIFSLVSLPISAILPSLTSDSYERSICNVFRMIFSVVGSIVVSAATMPLVNLFGKSNLQKGFFITAILYSIFSVAIMLNSWAHTRERITSINVEHISVREGIKSVVSQPWIILFACMFINNMVATVKNQSSIYYIQYYLKRPDLISVITTVPYLFCIIAVLFAPYLAKRLGYRNACILGLIVGILGNLILAVSGRNIAFLIIGSSISYIGAGIPFALLNAMFADVVDYAEWKTGVRATGLNYAACSFGVKVGQGIGAALGTVIMSIGHYIPNKEQSASSVLAIRFNYIWVAFIAMAIMILLLIPYKLDKSRITIAADLEKRRVDQIANL
ncbi:MAG: MFS transporter [Anaerocolumna sp.]